MVSNLKNLLRTIAAIFFPRPIFLFHKPTARCDCRCHFCDFWQNQPDRDDVLPTPEILSFLNLAKSAGFTTYILWGGEPLLVKDLPIWLKYTKTIGMETMFCTSGNYLSERAETVGPFTDRLILSIEAIGAKHDEIRGYPGLFNRVVEGLKRFKNVSDAQVIIWSHINRDNKNEVAGIARFAQQFKVKVEFFPTTRYSGYNEGMILNTQERETVLENVRELKRRGYPVNNTWYALDLMKSGRSFRCNIPLLSIQVYPDGLIYPCEKRVIPDLKPYGHINEIDLKKLFTSEVFQKESRRLLQCNNCLLPCVAHLADDLPIQGVRRVFGV
ncbi:MAG TPA: radical SAM protein [bacterium (Candidatus Stahlbacteria)]|nr:radical SAM protein [Candidatus Stahlbacteria bacterium]